MSSRVLDSSAVLAYLHRELGYKMVADLLEESGISTVNLAEVAGKLLDTKMSERHVQQVISDLTIEVIPFDEPLAYAVARLRQYTQKLGLSLGAQEAR